MAVTPPSTPPTPTAKPHSSGLLMGTRSGFQALVDSMRTSQPSFPCCSFWRPTTECFVDDQACLHAALLRLNLGTWPATPRACAGDRDGAVGSAPRAHESRRRRRRCSDTVAPLRTADHGVPRRCAPPPAAMGTMAGAADLTNAMANATVLHAQEAQPPLPSSIELDVRATDNASGARVRHHARGRVDFVLDVNARLFLNLFMVHPKHLDVNGRGQIVLRRTGIAPCVLHANAYKTPEQLEHLLARWTHITWVPNNATRLQRWLQQHVRRQQQWMIRDG